MWRSSFEKWLHVVKNNILYHFSRDTYKDIPLNTHDFTYVHPAKVIQYKKDRSWSAEFFMISLEFTITKTKIIPAAPPTAKLCKLLCFWIVVKTINICLDDVKLTHSTVLA